MQINKAYVNEQVVVKNYSNEEFSVRVKIIRNRPVLYSVLDIALTLDLLHDEYFLVIPFKEVIGLTTGEYIEHLRENEITILEHMKTWVI